MEKWVVGREKCECVKCERRISEGNDKKKSNNRSEGKGKGKSKDKGRFVVSHPSQKQGWMGHAALFGG